ncbi:tol-pal system protein YbgF [Geobacter sp. SVR]|uniref:tol-pal system protein YbgF n=1 Tax=Geobacter sp. SVR TaxID=2495594 RepID=UPI00143EFA9C|nr:tol-pal system protein YbgF [Geobacter sp. SVR]BCS55656.1 lipoprotein [Geobacter sp. SVR]GCF83660.1 lipoprotein [Geobacter sp. SVR]
MPSGTRWSTCVVICLTLAGCAADELVIKRQAEAEAKLEYLIQADKKSGQRLNELSGQILSLEDQLKGSSEQIRQLQSTILEVRGGQDELKARVVLLAQQAAPKVAVVNQATAHKTKDNGPPGEYVKAFGLYSTNHFTAAIEAFEAFLKNSPDSEYAANASYWIGECYYSMSELTKAAAAFQKTVDAYPKSSKAPDALLKLGYTLTTLKEGDKATAALESLIKGYPGSPAADKARQRLTAPER